MKSCTTLGTRTLSKKHNMNVKAKKSTTSTNPGHERVEQHLQTVELGAIRRDGELQPGGQHGQQPEDGGSRFWSAFDVIPCRDGKARRIPRQPEPGVQLVADGLPPEMAGLWDESFQGYPLAFQKVLGRVGLLRGAGNAIVPQVAAQFIMAFLEAEADI